MRPTVSSAGAVAEESLPPDWEQRDAGDGRVYYWNTKTEETTWTRPGRASDEPSSLPDHDEAHGHFLDAQNWVAKQADDGRTYYWNTETEVKPRYPATPLSHPPHPSRPPYRPPAQPLARPQTHPSAVYHSNGDALAVSF